MEAEPAFETKRLGAEPDATAPDGAAARLLLERPGGGMAHFELPAGAVSHAVAHTTVEEIWYILSGRGRIWRRCEATDRGRRGAHHPARHGVPVPRRRRRAA